MKIFLTIVLFLSVRYAGAQIDPGQELALRIAQRMKLELNLDPTTRDNVYQINLKLANQKQDVWKLHQGARLAHELQKIEGQRDSLYKTVLASDSLYQIYRRNKIKIVFQN